MSALIFKSLQGVAGTKLEVRPLANPLRLPLTVPGRVSASLHSGGDQKHSRSGSLT